MPENNKTIGVTSFKAGVGKSLLAVNLANQLQLLNNSIAFVDLSLPCGGSAFLLHKKSESWATVRPLLNDLISARKLDTVTQKSEFGFSYLGSPQNFVENEALSSLQLKNLIDSFRNYAKISVFDLPAVLDSKNIQGLTFFDEVLCIVTPEPEVIRATAHALVELRRQKISLESWRFVLNRWDRDALPHFKTELAKKLGITIASEIEEDSDAVWKHYFSQSLFTNEKLVLTQDFKNLAKIIFSSI